MAYAAVFSYRNIDATTDLNAHFRRLFLKGVVSGFEISPVAGTANVQVAPGTLVSNDGMVVDSDAAVTLACVGGRVNNIVFRAVHNSPAAPTLALEVMSDTNLATDPQRAFLVVVGRVDLSSVSTTSTSNISYSGSDRVARTGHNPLLGVFDNDTAMQTQWPSAAPVKMLPGDFALLRTGTGGQPSWRIWTGTAWLSFGNYEQFATDFAAHTSGLGNYPGTQIHVTPDEKAAIAGTAGTPGAGNRFVTETDTAILPTLAQKQALDNVITGPDPLSTSNPLVANGIPVAVPRVVAVTVTTAGGADFINILRADNGSGLPFFAEAVYVGKLGVDTDGRSTARNWFELQDAFLAGYVDEDGPLYVLNIQDASGSGSYNPAADNTNTNTAGYWNPSAPATSLRVKFNRAVAQGKTVYVRYYARGTMAGLAPQSQYAQAATAFSSAKLAYREVDTEVVRSLRVTSQADIVSAVLEPGSAPAPSLRFRNSDGVLTNTGFFYAGTVATTNYTVYSALGVSVESDTVALFAKSTEGDNPGLAAVQCPLVFEQVRNADSDVTYRIHTYRGVATESNIILGISSYADGFIPVLEVTASRVRSYKSLQVDGQLRLASGTAATPALTFSSADTGLYDVGTFATEDLSFYNGIGVSLKGKTAFVFASNTASASGLASGLDTPLLFEQFQDEDSNCSYRIAITEKDSSSNDGVLRFGRASYVGDFISYGEINRLGFFTSGRLAGTKLELGTNTSTYASVTATSNTLSLLFGNTAKYTYAAATDTTTISSNILSARKLTLTEALSVPGGTEAAPGLNFTGVPNTGVYYIGSFTSTEGVSSNSSIGFSLNGSTALVLGRNEAAASTFAAVAAPLFIEQAITGSDVEIRMSAMARVSEVRNTLVIGLSDYTNDFFPVLEFKNAQVTNLKTSLAVTGNISAAGNATFTGNVTGAAVTGSYYRTGTSTTEASVAYGLTTSGSSGLYGGAGLVGLAFGNNRAFAALSGSTNLYVDGTLVMSLALAGATLSVPFGVLGNVNVGGTLGVAGNVTVGGALIVQQHTALSTLQTAGGVTIAGPLAANGVSTFTGGAVFNCPVQFSDLELVDLTDVAVVTGPILDSFFTELGAVTPTANSVTAENIHDVFDGMGLTQAERVVTIKQLAYQSQPLPLASMIALEDNPAAATAEYVARAAELSGRPYIRRCADDGHLCELVALAFSDEASSPPWWLRTQRQQVRLQDKDTGRRTAQPTAITTWTDIAVSEEHTPEFGAEQAALIPPGVPVELDVFLTMVGGYAEVPGFGTTRDNIEFRFVWDQRGAANTLVWPGTILSSCRYGTGGSNTTWCLRFHGIQAGVLHVPQVPATFGTGPYWIGNHLPGGYIQVRPKAGSMVQTSDVSGAWIDFKFRERLPRDYGFVSP